jgi:hypothetical protein
LSVENFHSVGKLSKSTAMNKLHPTQKKTFIALLAGSYVADDIKRVFEVVVEIKGAKSVVRQLNE